MNLKNPCDCRTAEEVRNEIDKIDFEIIKLFSERHKYVEEIVKFKNDAEGVIALERKEQVIRQRKNWARENGLNEETFEKIYTLLVESNIKHEMELLRSKSER